jgi:hypothetical protein
LSQQQISPEKYIQTRARTLPIDKCYINIGWREARLANVFITRSHVTGNLTVGIYLVDLQCLGIKDTFYHFNIPAEKMDEWAEKGGLVEIRYNLAHNIVYAGHDYAYEFGIAPHKDFAITKFILEEDDDNIELQDIETGGPEGKPMLMVDSSYPAGPILQKLKQHAGEGNYDFLIGPPMDDYNDGDDDGDDDMKLEDVEYGDLDVDTVTDYETEDLGETLEKKLRPLGDNTVIRAELAYRLFLDKDGCGLEVLDDAIIETGEYKLFLSGLEGLKLSIAGFPEADQKVLTEKVDGIFKETASTEEETLPPWYFEKMFNLLYEYRQGDFATYCMWQFFPVVYNDFIYNSFVQQFESFCLLAQLHITASLLLNNRELPPPAQHIANALTIQQALPGATIHAMHCRFFWVVQSVQAIKTGNHQRALFFYELLSKGGIGVPLKALYCDLLAKWLLEDVMKINRPETEAAG